MFVQGSGKTLDLTDEQLLKRARDLLQNALKVSRSMESKLAENMIMDSKLKHKGSVDSMPLAEIEDCYRELTASVAYELAKLQQERKEHAEAADLFEEVLANYVRDFRKY